MSALPHAAAASACTACRDRSLLLARIGARLEIRARLRGRLLELLAMSDGDLLQAVGCRGNVEAPEPAHVPARMAQAICMHDARYPRALSDAGAPRMLYTAGRVEQLAALESVAAVAVCGSGRSTDYGIEMARGLAGELAAAGVTIVSGIADAVGAAAQGVAASLRGRGIAVVSGGLDVGITAPRRALAREIQRSGCLVAELPAGCDGRVWGRIAAARTVARLAAVTVVVEADETPVEMTAAQVARSLGKPVAAMPGRLTSRASRGAHSLLRGGAQLVRGSEDVFALADLPVQSARTSGTTHAETLDETLRTTLERVGAGCDAPDKLVHDGLDSSDALLALSRLEVMGLLARGDGGRYVRRTSETAAG
jgi:DNA processing protein